jgi:hypothetical protein
VRHKRRTGNLLKRSGPTVVVHRPNVGVRRSVEFRVRQRRANVLVMLAGLERHHRRNAVVDQFRLKASALAGQLNVRGHSRGSRKRRNHDQRVLLRKQNVRLDPYARKANGPVDRWNGLSHSDNDRRQRRNRA